MRIVLQGDQRLQSKFNKVAVLIPILAAKIIAIVKEVAIKAMVKLKIV